MANVIKTVLTYTLNGSTRDFNVPFEYLTRKFVTVTLLGTDRKVLTLATDYRFATRTTISTTKAWGPADGYTQIEIRRNTSATERLVDFTDGSILRAYDLNVAQIQTMHIAEEARDLTADTIGINNNGDLDARGRRIVNLGNAVEDRDAVPFGQLKTMNQNSWTARNEALNFRNQAEAFKNQAQGFRNEAEGFKNQAAASQNAAKVSETNSKNSEIAANNSKNAAAASQGAAKTSETNAANSAASSKAQADRANTEANRAKTEADKLSNWNALAGTISSVSGINVTFKGKVGALDSFVSAQANGYRIVQNNRGMIWRFDGTNGYILFTPDGQPHGDWNTLRPLTINYQTGNVSLGQATTVNNAPFTVYGNQLRVDNGPNKNAALWGLMNGAQNWFVGRGNDNSNEIALHSYALNTSLFLKSDQAWFNKSIRTTGEVQAGNNSSALQANGNIRGPAYAGGSLIASMERNRLRFERVFSGNWVLNGVATCSANISQQMLIFGINTEGNSIEYTNAVTPGAGGIFWINIGNWSYRIRMSADGLQATMLRAQGTSGAQTNVGAIKEIYICRTLVAQ